MKKEESFGKVPYSVDSPINKNAPGWCSTPKQTQNTRHLASHCFVGTQGTCFGGARYLPTCLV